MSHWISESGLTWRALHPFGVELRQNLSEPLSAEQANRFVRLLWEHSLLLARGQQLSMDRQHSVCALAGPILIREGETGYLTTQNGHAASLSELNWHADAAYTDAPFDAISLHAVDVVDKASSTCFISAAQAFDTLPCELRSRLESTRVEMISPHYDALGNRSCDHPDPVALKRGEQASIRINPHNRRRCIWVSELQAARITGMEWSESRDLLHAVYDHIYQTAHVLEHRWRNGDFIIWDNIGLQHKRGSLKDCGKRVLQRVIVGTEGVAPHISS